MTPRYSMLLSQTSPKANSAASVQHTQRTRIQPNARSLTPTTNRQRHTANIDYGKKYRLDTDPDYQSAESKHNHTPD